MMEPIDQVGAKARVYLKEIVRGNERASNQVTNTVEINWEPPRSTCFKINYDGVVFRESDEAGIGINVRDMHGRVKASLVQKVRYPQSMESIEGWATKRAIQIAIELGIVEAEFEGDS